MTGAGGIVADNARTIAFTVLAATFNRYRPYAHEHYTHSGAAWHLLPK